MARCRNCGEKVSFFKLRPGHICKECFIENQRNINYELVKRLGESPVHCHVIIKGVVAKLEKDSQAKIGDFFISTGGLIFIPYTFSLAPPKWAVPAAAALAGGVGAVGAAVVRHQENSAAGGRAIKARNEDHGLRLEDRLLKRGGIVIQKGEIESVDINSENGLMRLTYNNDYFIASIKDVIKCKQFIEDWLQDRIEDEPDILGANFGFPPPKEIIKQLSAMDTDKSLLKPILNKIPLAKEYYDKLFSLIYNSNYYKKEIMVQAIIKLNPDNFITNYRDDFIKAHKKIFSVSMICLIISCFLMFVMLYFPDSKEKLLIFFVIGIFTYFPLAISAIIGFIKWYRDREIMSLLNHHVNV